MLKMAEFHEPTQEEAVALFQIIEQKFPNGTLGDGKWYLVAVSWQTSIVILYLTSTSSLLSSELNPNMPLTFIPTSSTNRNSPPPNLDRPLYAVSGKPWSRTYLYKVSASPSKRYSRL
jgi:hypothetical protein